MKSVMVYFDHAAATPLDERVLAEMLPYFSEQFFNPSAPYSSAVEVKRTYQDAKHRLAVCIGGQHRHDGWRDGINQFDGK